MKPILTALSVSMMTVQSFGQYSDPNFPKPASGYGADGTHTVGVISFANPAWPSKDIEIFYPSDVSGKVPTLFYSHGFGANNSSNVSGLLNFVAKKGYAIVFVPYQTVGATVYERYDNLLGGFRKAARDYPAIVDTTRVGFVGHSFGGGASFGNAYKCFTQNNWGQNGRFIYATAQWYSYNISQSELQSFPNDVKLLTEVFDDDVTNDHRMAIDIFKNINIPAAEKDFILVKSDTISGYTYAADHLLPNTSSAFNSLDYYAYYRLLDALADYTFNGSPAGKNVAFGNGSAAQVTMPTGLKDLVQTDNPVFKYPESKYMFPCSDAQNPRSSYCSLVSGSDDHSGGESGLVLYPNPASGRVTVSFLYGNASGELKIFNSLGQIAHSDKINHRQSAISLDLSCLSSGVYVVIFGEHTTRFVVE